MEKDLDVYSWSLCGDCPCTVTGNLYFKTQAMSTMSAYMSALGLSLRSIRMSLPNDSHTPVTTLHTLRGLTICGERRLWAWQSSPVCYRWVVWQCCWTVLHQICIGVSLRNGFWKRFTAVLQRKINLPVLIAVKFPQRELVNVPTSHFVWALLTFSHALTFLYSVGRED